MKKDRILVIDDEKHIGETLRYSFNEKYEVEVCESGEEGWNVLYCSDVPCDLIIVDLNLPDTNGLELIKRIREISPQLPCIIITGHSTKERAESACNISISGYFTKPFDIEVLKLCISNILDHDRRLPVVAHLSPLPLHSDCYHPFTVAALAEIHRCFPKNITIEELAEKCNVSKFHLERIFTKNCGMPIHQYLIRLKIEKAKTLLSTSKFTVIYIADILGFKGKTRFFQAFKKYVGVTPAAFRANCSEENGRSRTAAFSQMGL